MEHFCDLWLSKSFLVITHKKIITYNKISWTWYEKILVKHICDKNLYLDYMKNSINSIMRK